MTDDQIENRIDSLEDRATFHQRRLQRIERAKRIIQARERLKKQQNARRFLGLILDVAALLLLGTILALFLGGLGCG